MQTKTKQKQKNHIKESIEKKTWFDGKRQIPLGEMTDEHLRAAKLHAQRREETLFHACGQWAEIVNMLEKEAKNRGVRLRDLKTSYQKNNRVLKNAMDKIDISKS